MNESPGALHAQAEEFGQETAGQGPPPILGEAFCMCLLCTQLCTKPLRKAAIAAGT
jgi:hypothetical protein